MARLTETETHTTWMFILNRGFEPNFNESFNRKLDLIVILAYVDMKSGLLEYKR